VQQKGSRDQNKPSPLLARRRSELISEDGTLATWWAQNIQGTMSLNPHSPREPVLP